MITLMVYVFGVLYGKIQSNTVMEKSNVIFVIWLQQIFLKFLNKNVYFSTNLVLKLMAQQYLVYIIT